MKKISLLISLFSFCLFTVLEAQSKHDFKPCGTPHVKSDWLKRYQQNPQQYRGGGTDTLYVPLTLHVVGTDDGSGYYTLSRLMDALCRLNLDFEASKIQFFVEGEINYLANSAYNNHQTVIDGANMMFANNVENTINCYVVDFAAGNCGYNLPYAGVCLAEGCIGENDHTWAHEIGHNLTIPHPFLGWEGGINYDGSDPHNYNNPAPTTVLYNYTNFQDTLILDTLIIDTAIVELVDGSNCSIAADGFCDTPPDYLSFRWDCNSNNQSPTIQRDPNGVQFQSDGSLFMSYAFDQCSSRFSDEQIAAMRANLLDEKADYLNHELPKPPVSDDPVGYTIPADGELAQYNAAYLEWEAVPNATHYIVEVSQVPNFGFLVTSRVVENNFVTLDDIELVLGLTYYWRLRPFNNFSYCPSMKVLGSFKAEQLLSANNIEGINAIHLHPNLVNQGQRLNLHLDLENAMDLRLKLYNVSGQILQTEQHQLGAGNHAINLAIKNLGKGMYFLNIEHKTGTLVEKILIQ